MQQIKPCFAFFEMVVAVALDNHFFDAFDPILCIFSGRKEARGATAKAGFGIDGVWAVKTLCARFAGVTDAMGDAVGHWFSSPYRRFLHGLGEGGQ